MPLPILPRPELPRVSPSLTRLLLRLHEARMREGEILDTFGAAETAHGAGCPEARALDSAVDAAHDAVGEALRALMGHRPRSLHEWAVQADALLDEAMAPEAVEALRRTVAPLLAPCPVAEAGERWAGLSRAYDAALAHDPAGDGCTPEARELGRALRDAEAAMLGSVPTSPEGVAALAELVWRECGPVSLPGGEAWEDEMNRPEALVLRALRLGAAHVAGTDRGDWPGPRRGPAVL